MISKESDIKGSSISLKNRNDLKRKKDFGIFYTDYSLAYNMIKELNINKNGVVLDIYTTRLIQWGNKDCLKKSA